nr:MAG TPA: hypothetical protein [Caudoviricetes sp.]
MSFALFSLSISLIIFLSFSGSVNSSPPSSVSRIIIIK